MTWQPIETAPDRRVLLTDGAIVVMGYRDATFKLPWRYGDDGQGALDATHWMPIPDPPKTSDPRELNNLEFEL